MENGIIAYKHITNCFGMVIINIEYGIEDFIKYALVVDNHIQKLHKAQIRYNLKGEPYFIDFNQHRQYMNEFSK